jgi:Glycosyltransferase family 87
MTETVPATTPVSGRASWAGGWRTGHGWRAVRDGLAIAGLLFAVYLFVVVGPQAGTVGFDAFSYWHLDIAHPYQHAVGSLGAFPYTPVAARLFWLASGLAWVDFLWLWMAILVATVIWLGWRQTLLVLAFPPVALELYHGNIQLLIAAAIALGFRYPAAWAFVLLTKVTPGVGLVWFAVRREWKRLGIALAVTGVILAVSLAIDGRIWGEWINGEVLPGTENGVGQPNLAIPLLLRLPAAAALVAWGGLTNRRWTVPAGAALALPVLWLSGLSILAAIPSLSRPQLQEPAAAGGSAR